MIARNADIMLYTETERSLGNARCGPTRFDAMGEAFDAWFAKNANVFESELLAEKHFLTDPENPVSIGCGTGCSRKGKAIPAVVRGR